MRGLFVTATDTGVGKTEVACALIANARAAGLDAVGMKPAQSGDVPGEPSDAERLRAAAGGVEPLEAICPYRFAAPLAPAVAARVEGREVSLARVLEAARALAARHAALVVEGAGGLLVPLTERETYADLAVALGLPVLVVARAGLGTVNHTALTVEALRVRGLTCAGIVIGSWPAEPDLAERCNLQDLPMITRVLVRGLLPEGLGRVTPDRFAAVARDTLGPIQPGDWQDPRA
jgi:dethiobiotin synthetase